MTKKTLWEHWTDIEEKKDIPVKTNELNLKIGQMITIDLLDYRDKDFTVLSIEEHKRRILLDSFTSNDYILTDKLRLRIFEKKYEMPDLLLRLHDEFEFNEGFINVIHEAVTSTFNIDDIGEFTPVGDLSEAAQIEFTVDLTLCSSYLEQWTFERTAKDEAGQEYPEILIIDLNKTTGWFRLWIGSVVHKDQLFIL